MLGLSFGALIRSQPHEMPDSVRTVLDGPGLAYLVTIEPDGRPQVSVVWVGLDGDEIVAGHLPEHRKIRNMRRDPRVAPSVEAGTRNQLGFDEYLGSWTRPDYGGRRCGAAPAAGSRVPGTGGSSFLQWMTRRRVTSRTSP